MQAESYKRKGELLKNVLHTIRRGDDTVAVTDYQTGELLEIPLDPKLSPAANLEAYFARYQKQSRGALVIQRQIEDLESMRSGLDAVEQNLERALRSEPPDLQGLESIEALPEVRRRAAQVFAQTKACSAACAYVSEKGNPDPASPETIQSPGRPGNLGWTQRRGKRLPYDAPGARQRFIFPSGRLSGQSRSAAYGRANGSTDRIAPGRLRTCRAFFQTKERRNRGHPCRPDQRCKKTQGRQARSCLCEEGQNHSLEAESEATAKHPCGEAGLKRGQVGKFDFADVARGFCLQNRIFQT